MLNDSPVGCQTRAVTEPQRDGGICEANDGEVFKNVTFKPLSRARKERAPGIPRGMMRGKARKPRQLPQRGSQAVMAGKGGRKCEFFMSTPQSLCVLRENAVY